MASMTMNADGTVTITLTAIEQSTFKSLPAGDAESTFSLYLRDKAKAAFADKFMTLSSADQADIATQITTKQPIGIGGAGGIGGGVGGGKP